MKRLLSSSFSLLLVFNLTAPNLVFGDDPKKDPDQIGNRRPRTRAQLSERAASGRSGKGPIAV